MIIYVDSNARMQGNGTKEMPFKRINDAAQVAKAGDEVLVYPGTYREYVNPKNGGEENARITYRSVEPLGAIITGAEEVKNWEKYKDNVWVCRVNNSVFGSYNPYTTLVYGDWYFGAPIRHAGVVYLNEKMLYEATTLEECLKGEVYAPSWEPEFSIYKWFSEQDGDETVIYANFQGVNPNEENVEINVRRNCFFPEETGRDYITVSGFNINKAATNWAPPAAFQDGMIGPHWSKGWIIEDCEISNSKCCGISLGKYLDPENDHYFTVKHLKSPTQMERDAVCRGQYHGWSKKTIGSHIVRRCNIHHCEQTGIVGRMGCVFSTIEDNHIHHINNMQELGGAEIAGIKFHAAIDVTIRRNHIHHTTMGIWCDWQAQGTRLSQNLLHHNELPEGTPIAPGAMSSQDIFVEVSHGPTLIDNNIMLSKASIRFSTQGVACVHNLILGAFVAVGSGTDNTVRGINQPRYTPYHIPHETEVSGFMTILHGDNRIYNNIFVQANLVVEAEVKEDMGFMMTDNKIVGNSVFDEYPTYDEWIKWFDMDVQFPSMHKLREPHFDHLPVWINGNAYFNKAEKWKNEENAFVDTEHEIFVKLVEKDGGYTIDTNIYEHLEGFKTSVICTETLGEAFEPEQRFENSDGSDIVFNCDYFNDHRSVWTIPGPFASQNSLENKLW